MAGVCVRVCASLCACVCMLHVGILTPLACDKNFLARPESEGRGALCTVGAGRFMCVRTRVRVHGMSVRVPVELTLDESCLWSLEVRDMAPCVRSGSAFLHADLQEFLGRLCFSMILVMVSWRVLGESAFVVHNCCWRKARNELCMSRECKCV